MMKVRMFESQDLLVSSSVSKSNSIARLTKEGKLAVGRRKVLQSPKLFLVSPLGGLINIVP